MHAQETGSAINTSLTALSRVVIALDPSANANHVPYRDSKLTRLLSNSLGGNSYTAVIATIHPVRKYMEKCLSALQFANRCRNAQPRVNYLNESGEKGKDARILLAEITDLRKQITHGASPPPPPPASSQTTVPHPNSQARSFD